MDKIFKPTWNSLKTHQTPQWFLDAKFGIYTHWGIYSVPAWGSNGTWYPYYMYREGSKIFNHHVKSWGHPSKFGYKDFIPLFTAKNFDPDEWAEIFKNSGAQFAGPVAEHHDGFTMWDSKINKWNAAKMGPKRDVVGELEKAIRSQGMMFMVALHHAENWWFYPHWIKEYDTSDPNYAGLYGPAHDLKKTELTKEQEFSKGQEKPSKEFLEQWKGKIQEVVDNYRPDLVWFDFGLGKIHDRYRREAIAHIYNREKDFNKNIAITYKELPKGLFNLPPGVGVLDLEVGKMNYLTPHNWLTDTSVDAGPNGTWSYVKNVGYKSVERLVHNLIDRVSKNGHLLLNVGPRSDGTIPNQAKKCLAGIGKWLDINGEAIFGTTSWQIFGEGPTEPDKSGGHFNENNEVRFTAHDIRYTVKDNNLYAIALGQPGDQITFSELRSLYESEIIRIRMLGNNQNLNWIIDDDGLTIDLPKKIPCEHAVSFKITMK